LRGVVLMQDEKVEMSFQCGRDSFVMTNKRVLKIDVQGATGKKVEYLTILWPAIKGFSGKNASHHDHDIFRLNSSLLIANSYHCCIVNSQQLKLLEISLTETVN
jgi:hypothetical protein